LYLQGPQEGLRTIMSTSGKALSAAHRDYVCCATGRGFGAASVDYAPVIALFDRFSKPLERHRDMPKQDRETYERVLRQLGELAQRGPRSFAAARVAALQTGHVFVS